MQSPPNEPAGPVKRTKLRWGESSPDPNPRLELGDTAGFVVALLQVPARPHSGRDRRKVYDQARCNVSRICAFSRIDGIDRQRSDPSAGLGLARANPECDADNPAGCLWGIWPSVRPGLDLLLWHRSLWPHLLWVPPLPVSTTIKQPQYWHWRPPSGGSTPHDQELCGVGGVNSFEALQPEAGP